jgi:hypothetical protein
MSYVDCGRERDAEGKPKAGALLDEADTPAFGFSYHNEVGYNIGDAKEYWNDWQTLYRVNWSEGYMKGNLEVVFRLHPERSDEVRDLIFLGIPLLRKHTTSWGQSDEADIRVSVLQSYFRDSPMLASITQSVECPDGSSFPSVVRFERSKEREDVRWKILTAASAYHVRFELRGGIGDRK